MSNTTALQLDTLVPDDNASRRLRQVHNCNAEVVELVDTRDSKSRAFTGVPVRLRPSVPARNSNLILFEFRDRKRRRALLSPSS